MTLPDIAVAAAFVDAGLVKVASEEEVEGFVKEAAAKPGDRLTAACAAALEKAASSDQEKLLREILTRLQREPIIPAAGAGALLGLYLGNETKKTRDQLGLPYNYEYEF